MIQNKKEQSINDKSRGILAEMSLSRPDRMGCGTVAFNRPTYASLV